MPSPRPTCARRASETDDIHDDGERVAVRLGRPRWLRVAHAAVVVLALGVPVLVFALTGDVPLRVLALPLTVLVLLLVARLQLRRELVADAFGVDRPRRGRRIGWGEVDHVEKPGPWDAVATLRLEDGARVNTGLPAHLAPRLAELGRVPLRD